MNLILNLEFAFLAKELWMPNAKIFAEYSQNSILKSSWNYHKQKPERAVCGIKLEEAEMITSRGI